MLCNKIKNLFRFKRLSVQKYSLFTVLIILFYANSINATLLDQNIQPTYIVGVVPQFETSKLHNIWNPILEHISAETGYRFVLKGAGDIPTFFKAVLAGDYDFAYMNPYQFVLASKKQNYRPLLRDVGRDLFGVLVTSKRSGISHVNQLKNKKLAFPAPKALGATLLIRQELKDDFGIEVDPVFVNTHDSVYLNVLLGKTAAGGGVKKTLEKQSDRYINALNILHETKKVAPHPIVALDRIPNEVTEAFTDSFMKLGTSSYGVEMLNKIPIGKVGKATVADYSILSTLNLERFHNTD